MRSRKPPLSSSPASLAASIATHSNGPHRDYLFPGAPRWQPGQMDDALRRRKAARGGYKLWRGQSRRKAPDHDRILFSLNYLEQVRRDIDYLEEHLDEELQPAEVASAAALSQWHFQRIFKTLTNETLKTTFAHVGFRMPLRSLPMAKKESSTSPWRPASKLKKALPEPSKPLSGPPRRLSQAPVSATVSAEASL